MNPVTFLLVSLSFTSLVLSIVFFVAWFTMGRERHALMWSATFAVALLQWLCNLARLSFPSPEVYWLVVSALGLTVVSLAVIGHLLRTHRSRSIQPVVISAVGCFLLIVWTTYVDPHFGLRVSIQPLFCSLLLSFACFLIYQHRPRITFAEWGALVSTGSFALLQLVAGLVAAQQGATRDDALAALYSQINFIGMPAAYISTSMFMILVMAADMAENLRELAMRDQLSGVFNRRGFYEAGERLFALAKRQHRPLSLIMADIDHFKAFNDRFGHLAGDNAIHYVAAQLSHQRRREDVVARIGGEEFVLILPGASAEAAQRVTAQLADQIRRGPVSGNTLEQQLTASFGIACLKADDVAFTQLIERADQALYQAKESGRNKAMYAPECVLDESPQLVSV